MGLAKIDKDQVTLCHLKDLSVNAVASRAAVYVDEFQKLVHMRLFHGCALVDRGDINHVAVPEEVVRPVDVHWAVPP